MDRRSFLRGGLSLIAAPAIVRVSSLMPVRGIVLPNHFIDQSGYVAGERISVYDLLRIGDDGRLYRMNATGMPRLAGIFIGGPSEPGAFVPASDVQLSGTLIKLLSS